jgi:hypothetical protein
MSFFLESEPETQLRGSQILNLKEVTYPVGAGLRNKPELPQAQTQCNIANNDQQVFFFVCTFGGMGGG